MEYKVRVMTIEDYQEVFALWNSIQGFGIRTIDDSFEGIERFLKRNPTTSMVAVSGGKIIGAILCGHDGRRGCLYHVCVDKDFRNHGVGQKMVEACLKALEEEKINKVNLIAFKTNEVGNRFWKGFVKHSDMGWTVRDDVNYYECVLNKENITNFIH